MSKIVCILLALVCLQAGMPFFALAQSNYSETLTITTYYPSPYGVYRNLEVKSGLAVGDITQGPLGSMDNLTSGQLYINNSLVLNSLAGTPAPAFSKAGQVIYVNNATSGERMLKFHNGNVWMNATGYPACIANQTCGACPTGGPQYYCYANCTEGSTCAACPSGQVCRLSSWVAPCTSGYHCQPDNYVAPCPSGQSCQAPTSTVNSVITYTVWCGRRQPNGSCPPSTHEALNTQGRCGNQISCGTWWGVECAWFAVCYNN